MNTTGACVRKERSKRTGAACSADLIVEIRAQIIVCRACIITRAFLQQGSLRGVFLLSF